MRRALACVLVLASSCKGAARDGSRKVSAIAPMFEAYRTATATFGQTARTFVPKEYR